MAYEIKIKGLKETMMAENHGAVSVIKEKWERFMKNEIEDVLVTISGWTGTLASIVYFKETTSSASSSSSFDIAWREAGEKYMKERNSFLKLDPMQKAMKLGFFRMVYWGFTGEKSEEVMIKNEPIESLAIKIQEKFFRENPSRMICNPSLFKPLIKSIKCQVSIQNLIEAVITQDMRLAIKNT